MIDRTTDHRNRNGNQRHSPPPICSPDQNHEKVPTADPRLFRPNQSQPMGPERMKPMKINPSSLRREQRGPGHYRWCVLARVDLGVTVEELPPGVRTDFHFHKNSRQFLYVIRGKAFVRLAGHHHPLKEGECIEIGPGIPHQVANRGDQLLKYLLVSAPNVRGNDIHLVSNFRI